MRKSILSLLNTPVGFELKGAKNQPRVPAGSSRGGEFTSASGSSILSPGEVFFQKTQTKMESKINDPKSMAYGGRLANKDDVKEVYHTTAPLGAMAILEKGFKGQDDLIGKKEVDRMMREGGEKVKDYGSWVYIGLNEGASKGGAVNVGVTLVVDASRSSTNAVVKEKVEGGIVLFHKNVVGRVIDIKIDSSIKDTKEAKQLLSLWEKKKPKT